MTHTCLTLRQVIHAQYGTNISLLLILELCYSKVQKNVLQFVNSANKLIRESVDIKWETNEALCEIVVSIIIYVGPQFRKSND